MSDKPPFRWAGTSARLLAGTLLSTLAVVAVVTAVSVPWPTIAQEPASVSAVPAPAASVIACSGGVLTIGSQFSDASALDLAARQSVVSGVAEGVAEPTETELTVPQAPGDSVASFTSLPADRTRTDVAASGASTVRTEALAGFAASACRPPLMESWLVGGSADTGAADLVVLSNPGTVPATVQLTVYGVDGAQTPPGGADLVVAPGTQQIVPLAGLALGEASPVVRVSSTGAPVSAGLQTSITRVLTPGGVDQVGPVRAPETTQIIAGVAVTASPGELGASDSATLLRVLAPSADTTAEVRVSPIGASNGAVESRTVELTAGEPAEVDLGGLAVGTYTVQVDAAEPVVAAVWQATGFDEGDDFAWFTPAPLVETPSLFATTRGPLPTLSLVNDDDEPAVVSVASVDGAFRLEVTVPAQGSTLARLSARTVYLLESDGTGVRAGLTLSGDGALAGFPVWPADAASPAITVYP